ncbi:MAG: PH domain-containing protein [Acidobacteria bacterium]|nr:PH domain-containing protein [Acidobacteriota bacterium]
MKSTPNNVDGSTPLNSESDSLLIWGFSRFAALSVILIGIFSLMMASRKAPPQAQIVLQSIEYTALFAVVATLPFSFFLQRLDYEMRWYIVTDRSLRIRDGIWNVEELTMTFANIQDLRITAGPIQGWLGLADLEVSSAGGGGGGGAKHGVRDGSHIARFAGVDNAVEIRDLIQDRLRRYRDAGLGDPGSPQAPASTEEAAAELLAEAKALRAAVS